jgi:hypothetical protein
MPAEGRERLERDIEAAQKLPPVSRAQRIERLVFLRDSSAADAEWALSLGGMSGSQIDGILAGLRTAVEKQDYFSVVSDPAIKAEAGRRRFALQELLKSIIAASAVVDASPEA